MVRRKIGKILITSMTIINLMSNSALSVFALDLNQGVTDSSTSETKTSETEESKSILDIVPFSSDEEKKTEETTTSSAESEESESENEEQSEKSSAQETKDLSKKDLLKSAAFVSDNNPWINYADVVGFADGDGTAKNPYVINTPEQLARMSLIFRDKIGTDSSAGIYFELGADVDMSAHDWTPINAGADVSGYGGSSAITFNGQGHTISGLTIKQTDNLRPVGFFGEISEKSLSVSKVKFEDSKVTSTTVGGVIVGAITGRYGSDTFAKFDSIEFINTILNGTTTEIEFDEYRDNKWIRQSLGGIAGYIDSAELNVENIKVSALTAEAYKNVSALVGMAANCYEDANKNLASIERFSKIELNENVTVTAHGDHAGGILGYAQDINGLTVDYVTLAAEKTLSVTAADYAGGLVGRVESRGKYGKFNKNELMGIVSTNTSTLRGVSSAIVGSTGALNDLSFVSNKVIHYTANSDNEQLISGALAGRVSEGGTAKTFDKNEIGTVTFNHRDLTAGLVGDLGRGGTAIVTNNTVTSVTNGDGVYAASPIIPKIPYEAGDGVLVNEFSPEHNILFKITGEDTAEIVGAKIPEEETELFLPSMVYYEDKMLTVTSIGKNAFKDMTTLTKIGFESNPYLLKIKASAFEGLVNVTEIQNFESLTGLIEIGASAFKNLGNSANASTKRFTFPQTNNPVQLREAAFYGLGNFNLLDLSLANFSQGETNDFAFQYGKFYNLNMPTMSVGAMASLNVFSNLANLTKLDLTDYTGGISYYEFQNNPALTYVKFGNRDYAIYSYYSFEGCTNLTAIDWARTSDALPNGVPTSILYQFPNLLDITLYTNGSIAGVYDGTVATYATSPVAYTTSSTTLALNSLSTYNTNPKNGSYGTVKTYSTGSSVGATNTKWFLLRIPYNGTFNQIQPLYRPTTTTDTVYAYVFNGTSWDSIGSRTGSTIDTTTWQTLSNVAGMTAYDSNNIYVALGVGASTATTTPTGAGIYFFGVGLRNSAGGAVNSTAAYPNLPWKAVKSAPYTGYVNPNPVQSYSPVLYPYMWNDYSGWDEETDANATFQVKKNTVGTVQNGNGLTNLILTGYHAYVSENQIGSVTNGNGLAENVFVGATFTVTKNDVSAVTNGNGYFGTISESVKLLVSQGTIGNITNGNGFSTTANVTHLEADTLTIGNITGIGKVGFIEKLDSFADYQLETIEIGNVPSGNGLFSAMSDTSSQGVPNLTIRNLKVGNTKSIVGDIYAGSQSLFEDSSEEAMDITNWITDKYGSEKADLYNSTNYPPPLSYEERFKLTNQYQDYVSSFIVKKRTGGKTFILENAELANFETIVDGKLSANKVVMKNITGGNVTNSKGWVLTSELLTGAKATIEDIVLNQVDLTDTENSGETTGLIGTIAETGSTVIKNIEVTQLNIASTTVNYVGGLVGGIFNGATTDIEKIKFRQVSIVGENSTITSGLVGFVTRASTVTISNNELGTNETTVLIVANRENGFTISAILGSATEGLVLDLSKNTVINATLNGAKTQFAGVLFGSNESFAHHDQTDDLGYYLNGSGIESFQNNLLGVGYYFPSDNYLRPSVLIEVTDANYRPAVKGLFPYNDVKMTQNTLTNTAVTSAYAAGSLIGSLIGIYEEIEGNTLTNCQATTNNESLFAGDAGVLTNTNGVYNAEDSSIIDSSINRGQLSQFQGVDIYLQFQYPVLSYDTNKYSGGIAGKLNVTSELVRNEKFDNIGFSIKKNKIVNEMITSPSYASGLVGLLEGDTHYANLSLGVEGGTIYGWSGSGATPGLSAFENDVATNVENNLVTGEVIGHTTTPTLYNKLYMQVNLVENTFYINSTSEEHYAIGKFGVGKVNKNTFGGTSKATSGQNLSLYLLNNLDYGQGSTPSAFSVKETSTAYNYVPVKSKNDYQLTASDNLINIQTEASTLEDINPESPGTIQSAITFENTLFAISGETLSFTAGSITMSEKSTFKNCLWDRTVNPQLENGWMTTLPFKAIQDEESSIYKKFKKTSYTFGTGLYPLVKVNADEETQQIRSFIALGFNAQTDNETLQHIQNGVSLTNMEGVTYSSTPSFPVSGNQLMVSGTGVAASVTARVNDLLQKTWHFTVDTTNSPSELPPIINDPNINPIVDGVIKQDIFDNATYTDSWNNGTAVAMTGSGTKEAPYQIASAGNLVQFRIAVENLSDDEELFAELTDDISLEGKYWEPISKESETKVTIYLNGQNHWIKGLSTAGTEMASGLFGRLDNVSISMNSIVFSLPIVRATNSSGTIVGTAVNSQVSIDNVAVIYPRLACLDTHVDELHSAGGFVGATSGGATTIKNSYFVRSLTNDFTNMITLSADPFTFPAHADGGAFIGITHSDTTLVHNIVQSNFENGSVFVGTTHGTISSLTVTNNTVQGTIGSDAFGFGQVEAQKVNIGENTFTGSIDGFLGQGVIGREIAFNENEFTGTVANLFSYLTDTDTQNTSSIELKGNHFIQSTSSELGLFAQLASSYKIDVSENVFGADLTSHHGGLLGYVQGANEVKFVNNEFNGQVHLINDSINTTPTNLPNSIFKYLTKDLQVTWKNFFFDPIKVEKGEDFNSVSSGSLVGYAKYISKLTIEGQQFNEVQIDFAQGTENGNETSVGYAGGFIGAMKRVYNIDIKNNTLESVTTTKANDTQDNIAGGLLGKVIGANTLNVEDNEIHFTSFDTTERNRSGGLIGYYHVGGKGVIAKNEIETVTHGNGLIGRNILYYSPEDVEDDALWDNLNNTFDSDPDKKAQNGEESVGTGGTEQILQENTIGTVTEGNGLMSSATLMSHIALLNNTVEIVTQGNGMFETFSKLNTSEISGNTVGNVNTGNGLFTKIETSHSTEIKNNHLTNVFGGSGLAQEIATLALISGNEISGTVSISEVGNSGLIHSLSNADKQVIVDNKLHEVVIDSEETETVGGLIGKVGASSSVEVSRNELDEVTITNVKGARVGGLVGWMYGGQNTVVSQNQLHQAQINVTPEEDAEVGNSGGLIGELSGSHTNSFNGNMLGTITMNGKGLMGGLVGYVTFLRSFTIDGTTFDEIHLNGEYLLGGFIAKGDILNQIQITNTTGKAGTGNITIVGNSRLGGFIATAEETQAITISEGTIPKIDITGSWADVGGVLGEAFVPTVAVTNLKIDTLNVNAHDTEDDQVIYEGIRNIGGVIGNTNPLDVDIADYVGDSTKDKKILDHRISNNEFTTVNVMGYDNVGGITGQAGYDGNAYKVDKNKMGETTIVAHDNVGGIIGNVSVHTLTSGTGSSGNATGIAISMVAFFKIAQDSSADGYSNLEITQNKFDTLTINAGTNVGGLAGNIKVVTAVMKQNTLPNEEINATGSYVGGLIGSGVGREFNLSKNSLSGSVLGIGEWLWYEWYDGYLPESSVTVGGLFGELNQAKLIQIRENATVLRVQALWDIAGIGKVNINNCPIVSIEDNTLSGTLIAKDEDWITRDTDRNIFALIGIDGWCYDDMSVDVLRNTLNFSRKLPEEHTNPNDHLQFTTNNPDYNSETDFANPYTNLDGAKSNFYLSVDADNLRMLNNIIGIQNAGNDEMKQIVDQENYYDRQISGVTASPNSGNEGDRVSVSQTVNGNGSVEPAASNGEVLEHIPYAQEDAYHNLTVAELEEGTALRTLKETNWVFNPGFYPQTHVDGLDEVAQQIRDFATLPLNFSSEDDDVKDVENNFTMPKTLPDGTEIHYTIPNVYSNFAKVNDTTGLVTVKKKTIEDILLVASTNTNALKRDFIFDIMSDNPENGSIKVLKLDQFSAVPENIYVPVLGERVLAGVTFAVRPKGNMDESKVLTLTTGEDGIVNFDELDFGEYELWEVTSAEGYLKPSNEVIEVNLTASNPDQEFILKNSLIPKLPFTGMGDVNPFIFLVLGLLILGGYFMISQKHKKKLVSKM
ncbi:MAG: leucine-rich repeat protein [Lactobacillales bacterium]|nr:leucine-rich repeat protein [Lactobacillales bacterium]